MVVEELQQAGQAHALPTQPPADRALALSRVPPSMRLWSLTVLSLPPHRPVLVCGCTPSPKALISLVLALWFQPHGRAGTWHFCTRRWGALTCENHQTQSLKGRQERLFWLDTWTEQDSNSTSPFYPIFPLFHLCSPVFVSPQYQLIPSFHHLCSVLLTSHPKCSFPIENLVPAGSSSPCFK